MLTWSRAQDKGRDQRLHTWIHQQHLLSCWLDQFCTQLSKKFSLFRAKWKTSFYLIFSSVWVECSSSTPNYSVRTISLMRRISNITESWSKPITIRKPIVLHEHQVVNVNHLVWGALCCGDNLISDLQSWMDIESISWPLIDHWTCGHDHLLKLTPCQSPLPATKQHWQFVTVCQVYTCYLPPSPWQTDFFLHKLSPTKWMIGSYFDHRSTKCQPCLGKIILELQYQQIKY